MFLTVIENVEIPLLLNKKVNDKERRQIAEKSLIDVVILIPIN